MDDIYIQRCDRSTLNNGSKSADKDEFNACLYETFKYRAEACACWIFFAGRHSSIPEQHARRSHLLAAVPPATS